MGVHFTSTPKTHQILPRLRGRVGRGSAASKLAQVAKTYPLWLRLPLPRKRGRFSRRAPGRDYGSAGTAFLGIRAVFAGKTGFLQVYGAAGRPIYDLFLVAN